MTIERHSFGYEDIFERFPQLLDVPGIDTNVKIMGDGSLAIVIRSAQTGIVYKLPHEGNAQIIENEFREHERFLLTLREGRESGEIPEYIKIPSIRHNLTEHAGLFAQEGIDGLTLKSIQIIMQDPRLKGYDRGRMLEDFTDYELKELFVEQLGADEEDFDFDYNDDAINKLGKYVSPEKFEAFRKALEYLEAKGCKHKDLHNSNVMIDRKGNIYIIDFGEVIQDEDNT